MTLLSLQNLSFDYGREPILSGVGLSVNAGVRAALVGPNGAGKSTLLALLAGDLLPLSGTRQLSGGVTTRLLDQKSSLAGDEADGRPDSRRVYEIVAERAFAEELRLEGELAELAAAIAAAAGPADALVERQGALQAEYERRSGYAWRSRLEAALSGLGVPEALWNRDPESLSGGERRRAALASVLLAGADVLLLDEPTNHLDLVGREWLEGFLTRFAGAVVLVSHDREFLDRVATETWHLAGAALSRYAGNYSTYLRARGERERQQQTAQRRQAERIARTEDFIRRNLAGQKTKQAQSRRRQLEREERLAPAPGPERSYRMRLDATRSSGATVIEAEGLAKGFDGRLLFRDVSLLLARGQRLGVIGPNGCGKSTLLRVLAGEENPDAGRLHWGHNVDLGVYDQHLRNVKDERTVLEEIQDAAPGAAVGELRSRLAAFGFGADAVDRPVARLSGGERGKLSLLRLIAEGHNTLLLDEPTNHLDLAAREALEEALCEFSGTLIVVSHDRRLLDRVVDRLLVFGVDPGDPSRVTAHVGNYAEWVRRREEERRVEAAAAPARSAGPAAASGPAPGDAAGALSKNEIIRRRRWIAEAEAEIERVEAARDEALAEMSGPEPGPDRRRELGELVRQLEETLSGLLERWEGWHDEISGG